MFTRRPLLMWATTITSKMQPDWTICISNISGIVRDQSYTNLSPHDSYLSTCKNISLVWLSIFSWISFDHHFCRWTIINWDSCLYPIVLFDTCLSPLYIGIISTTNRTADFNPVGYKLEILRLPFLIWISSPPPQCSITIASAQIPTITLNAQQKSVVDACKSWVNCSILKSLELKKKLIF